jgi:hypothetical protein
MLEDLLHIELVITDTELRMMMTAVVDAIQFMIEQNVFNPRMFNPEKTETDVNVIVHQTLQHLLKRSDFHPDNNKILWLPGEAMHRFRQTELGIVDLTFVDGNPKCALQMVARRQYVLLKLFERLQ